METRDTADGTTDLGQAMGRETVLLTCAVAEPWSRIRVGEILPVSDETANADFS